MNIVPIELRGKMKYPAMIPAQYLATELRLMITLFVGAATALFLIAQHL